MRQIEESELILNPDGSIFHLHLLPDEIADNIIFVGDQGRVEMISSYFDILEVKKQNREFITHTGKIGNKRISVVSTGIGTDNIDIVLNEIDALVNINLDTRTEKENKKSLNIIRIGTSGSLQEDIPVDTPVASKYAIGFDGLLNFYANRNSICDLEIEKKLKHHLNWNPQLCDPYIIKSNTELLNKIAFDIKQGFTISAPGFYGPQGRVLRLPIQDNDINTKISSFNSNDLLITNYEMECSAIYGLSALMGHNALTVCCIIANRMRKEYSKDYKKAVQKLVETILDRI